MSGLRVNRGLRGDLKQKGSTMVGIFHDLELMRQIADLKLSMLDGVLTAVA
jgi:alpha-D-ribose 1-methylphosphonate 5-triphosphate synthase subunit PhnL